jgi:hypothetical protein
MLMAVATGNVDSNLGHVPPAGKGGVRAVPVGGWGAALYLTAMLSVIHP